MYKNNYLNEYQRKAFNIKVICVIFGCLHSTVRGNKARKILQKAQVTRSTSTRVLEQKVDSIYQKRSNVS